MNTVVKIFRVIISIIGILFLLIAVGFGIAWGAVNSSNQSFYDSADVVIGTVLEADSQNTQTEILYSINGKEYTKSFSASSSELKRGDVVTVYYTSSSNVHVKEIDQITTNIFLLFAIIFGIVGLCLVVIVNVVAHFINKSLTRKALGQYYNGNMNNVYNGNMNSSYNGNMNNGYNGNMNNVYNGNMNNGYNRNMNNNYNGSMNSYNGNMNNYK